MVKLKDIIEALKPYAVHINGENTLIGKVIKSDVANKTDNVIFWVSPKFNNTLSQYSHGVIICDHIPLIKNENCNFIAFENPRKAFQELLKLFYSEQVEYKIASSAKIAKEIVIGKRIKIGENVVIEKNCEIGENVIIGNNNVICAGTKIRNNVVIGHNNTIGGVGFGYEKDSKGIFHLIQHLGGVIIEDNVEIGNNTCIDKAVLGDTIIGAGTKVDNLVHIAHNVIIGSNCAIIANSMIGGSTVIKDGAWIAPSAALRDGLYVEKNSVIGLGAVLTKSTSENEIWAGNPAKKFEKKQL